MTSLEGAAWRYPTKLSIPLQSSGAHRVPYDRMSEGFPMMDQRVTLGASHPRTPSTLFPNSVHDMCGLSLFRDAKT